MENNNTVRKKRNYGSFKQGQKGALIFGFIAAILCLIIVLINPRLYGVSSVLIPTFAVTGYIHKGGRRGYTKKSSKIIFLTSFIMVFIIGLLSKLITLSSGHHVSIGSTIKNIGYHIFSFQFWISTVLQCIVPMIFVILCMNISMQRIYKLPKPKKKMNRA